MTVSKNTLAPRCELPITSFSVLSENNGIKITINYNNNDQLHFTTFTSMPNEPWLPLVSFLQFALNKTYEDVSMPVFLHVGCPSCHATNSVKALNGRKKH